MKKIVLAAVAATIAVPAAAAPGVDEATAQGSATAEIVAPISIVHTGTALDFGIIVSPTADSVVRVSGTSATVISGDAVQLGNGAEDSFTVYGDPGRAITISTTGGSLGTMSFTTSSPTTGTLDATTGDFEFFVTGDLDVPAGQAAGVFTGSYDATVAYQ